MRVYREKVGVERESLKEEDEKGEEGKVSTVKNP